MTSHRIICPAGCIFLREAGDPPSLVATCLASKIPAADGNGGERPRSSSRQTFARGRFSFEPLLFEFIVDDETCVIGKEKTRREDRKDHDIRIIDREGGFDLDSIRFALLGEKLIGRFSIGTNEKFQRKGSRATLPDSAYVKLQRNSRGSFRSVLVVHD